MIRIIVVLVWPLGELFADLWLLRALSRPCGTYGLVSVVLHFAFLWQLGVKRQLLPCVFALGIGCARPHFVVWFVGTEAV